MILCVTLLISCSQNHLNRLIGGPLLQAPPPWSAEGKKMSKKFGLALQYPEGYLEAQAASQPQDEDKGKGRKRKGGSGMYMCVVCTHNTVYVHCFLNVDSTHHR